MWKTVFKCAVLIGVVLSWSTTTFGLLDNKLCADPECKQIISTGITTISYPPNVGLLGFQINSNVRIYEKSNGEYWGIEVNGRRGLAPKKFIKETKIFVSEKKLIEVPVEQPNAAQTVENTPNVELKASEEVIKMDIMSTTTRPLDTVVSTEKLNLVIDTQKTDSQTPQLADGVKRMEVIEGTQIPVMDDFPTMLDNNSNDISIEDDEEDDDEDEYEEDDDDDDDYLEKELKAKAKLNQQFGEKPSQAENEKNVSQSIFEKTEVLSAEAIAVETNDGSKEGIKVESNSSLDNTKDKEDVSNTQVDGDNKVPFAETSLFRSNEQTLENSTTHGDEKLDNTMNIVQNQFNNNIVESKQTENVVAAPEVKNTENAEQQQQIVENNNHNKVVDNNDKEKIVDSPEEIKYNAESITQQQQTVESNNSERVNDKKTENVAVKMDNANAENATQQTVENNNNSNKNEIVNEKMEDANAENATQQQQTVESNKSEIVNDKETETITEKLEDANTENATQQQHAGESSKNEVVDSKETDNIAAETKQTENNTERATLEPQTIDSEKNEVVDDKEKENIATKPDETEKNIDNDTRKERTHEKPKRKKSKKNTTLENVTQNSSENTSEELASSLNVQSVPVSSDSQPAHKPPLETNGERVERSLPDRLEPVTKTDEQPVLNNESSETKTSAEQTLQETLVVDNVHDAKEFNSVHDSPVTPQPIVEPNIVPTPNDIPSLNENIINPNSFESTAKPILEGQQISSNDERIKTEDTDKQTTFSSTETSRQEQNSAEETTTTTERPHVPNTITESDNYYPQPDLPLDETTVTPIMSHPEGVYTHSNQPSYLEQERSSQPPNAINDENEQYTQYTTQPHYTTGQSQAYVNPNTIGTPETHNPIEDNSAAERHERHIDPIALPTQSLPQVVESITKDKGLFSTIMETVNSFISTTNKKDVNIDTAEDMELQRILFPDKVPHTAQPNQYNAEGYCEKMSNQHCPSKDNHHNAYHSSSSSGDCTCSIFDVTIDNFAQVLLSKMIEMTDLLLCLGIAAASTLLFLFGYYCFYSSSKEGVLLSRLNMLERSLLATHKENAILQHDLVTTRNKLSCIEDNSFGSNDMVVSLKQELDEELHERERLKEQISHLEKELENAAEAGLELNKIVSELLNNQTGDESIISSVEELQRQLNEQQNTISEINANLAEKSRENSELQLMIAEQNARMGGTIASLQQDNDELDAEKSNLQTRMEVMKVEFEEDITRALEGKNFEIKRLQNEIVELNTKYEDEHTRRQTSQAKIEALEECLKNLKKDPNVNVKQIIDVANVRAEMLDMQKKLVTLKEKLDVEMDGRRLAEDKLNAILTDGEKLKQDFHQSEKDKLEAQTRLEVLSNYFKEKETQLQKELSLKEAMWLKQQGEAVSTVDRLTTMQDEIQSLKSQNDSLRAEIEAQLAAHKAHTGTLENRAHETWLALRQAERRYEETRTEATALRRKLTLLVAGGTNPNDPNRAVVEGKIGGGDLNNAPSPIPLPIESPGSPLLGRMPPPPFLPPPFMGPPQFLGMPPPFATPGEMRLPPLGRMMSPPPSGNGNGGSGGGSGVGGGSSMHPSRVHRSGRVGYTSHDHAHYDDYDDEEDDDDDDDEDYEEEEETELHRDRRRHRDSDGSWRRNSYSPPPRTYRSHSPADSRYNDRDLMSTYDTETDFSPPPSPHGRSGGSGGGGGGGGGSGGGRGVYGGNSSSNKPYSPQPTASSPVNDSNNGRKKKKRQTFSSDSDKSRYSGHR